MIVSNFTLETAIEKVGLPFQDLAVSMGVTSASGMNIAGGYHPRTWRWLEAAYLRVQPHYMQHQSMRPDLFRVVHSVDGSSEFMNQLKKIRQLEKTYGVDGDNNELQSLYDAFPQTITPLTDYPEAVIAASEQTYCEDRGRYGQPGPNSFNMIKEVIVNAVEHGARFGELGSVLIQYFHGTKGFLAVVEDPGTGFTSLESCTKDIWRGAGMERARNLSYIDVGFERIEPTGFRALVFYRSLR